jgi:hypothetical protein
MSSRLVHDPNDSTPALVVRALGAPGALPRCVRTRSVVAARHRPDPSSARSTVPSTEACECSVFEQVVPLGRPVVAYLCS